MTMSAADLADGSLNITLDSATKNSNGTISANINQWQYAVLFKINQSIESLVAEQRATRKVLERIDRRLAKRVKLS